LVVGWVRMAKEVDHSGNKAVMLSPLTLAYKP
jgi:hypothetical protein